MNYPAFDSALLPVYYACYQNDVGRSIAAIIQKLLRYPIGQDISEYNNIFGDARLIVSYTVSEHDGAAQHTDTTWERDLPNGVIIRSVAATLLGTLLPFNKT